MKYPTIIEYNEEAHLFNSNVWDSDKASYSAPLYTYGWMPLLVIIDDDFLMSDQWVTARIHIKESKANFKDAERIAITAFADWLEEYALNHR